MTYLRVRIDAFHPVKTVLTKVMVGIDQIQLLALPLVVLLVTQKKYAYEKDPCAV